MKYNNYVKIALGSGAKLLGVTLRGGGALADPIGPASDILRQYLVIGTGNGTVGDEFAAFQQSDTEIGADQELVSTSDNGPPSQRTGSLPDGSTPNLFDVFKERWNNDDPNHPNDTVGNPDTLPGARPIFEGIDFSGNVALTGALAKFESSNSDVNAGIGIDCNRASGCFPNPSGDNSYFSGAAGDPEADLNAGAGINQFDPTTLNTQISNFRDFVNGLTADANITSDIVDQNVSETAGASIVTNLDNVDAGVATSGVTNIAGSAGHGDGIAVIDIEVGANNKFSVNNSDWILNTLSDTFAIFRLTDNSNLLFDNSSIVLGGEGGTIQDWGAMFYTDDLSGTNILFDLSNSILGGIALWDLTDFNSANGSATGDRTGISMSNAQGCGQFISHKVIMSNNRWTRCSADAVASVSEPGTLALFGIGIAGLGILRRRRKASRT